MTKRKMIRTKNDPDQGAAAVLGLKRKTPLRSVRKMIVFRKRDTIVAIVPIQAIENVHLVM